MTGPLTGSVALVTGASSGLGRASAVALARAGAHVIVHGRDAGRLAAVAREVCGTALTGDLADPAEAERLAAAALAVAGRVDVLLCNAGVGWSGPFTAMPAADAARLVAVNLAAPVALTRLLLPGMLENGGRLVYVTSIAGRLGVAGEAVYSATKAGLDMFAVSLRQELRGSGVGVGVLVPGVVDTPFFERRGEPYTRRRPRPIPADRVADALVAGIVAGSAEIFAPGWLRLPVVVRGLFPGAYRALDGRFGARTVALRAGSG
ncbi:SDR family NAD(P)-dependent oxidoreductase [Actinomadura rayongensis]|uniref:SDR family NAD(P)-dependent oxidoreductase n=1 Tax=Actinomadura rayongensis TaxID=1429076 RepID=A0A6I4WHV6_9ACTN|nr:SDR family NAD(P)-dependent oxidoreductase [Actinomadura rayongensis]MXQ67915.1 SDR family NAD(P)-dependent oxidoreductase [Actinomadura rayongensis]